ncbi:hypothetical protein BGX30_006736, partial [Mortierella sp. GBA39]
MPMLLVAIPLQKSWLGLSYWRTPSVMELPVELEYIPYEEFEERFSRLNQIARPTYPTIWPNVLMVFIFGALIVTAAVGMARNQAGLAVMGQVACFVIPVLAILWIRVRKEGKARARKQFKRRSIKLLREWTEQDTTAFAIQWKLRLRVWNDVRRRRAAAIAAAAGSDHNQEQEQDQDQEVDDMREQLPAQQQSVPIHIESVDGNNNDTDTQTTTTIQRPPRVADVYAALRLPTPPNYITSDTDDTPTLSTPSLTTTTTPSRGRMRTPPSQQAPQQQQQEASSTQSTSDSPHTLLET